VPNWLPEAFIDAQCAEARRGYLPVEAIGWSKRNSADPVAT
jgi:hypothetical protein